ncbi:MAG: hypothetical protein OQK01_05930 [Xanthomonadales bacterium]|jgi:hypothetical protein|nr:hypothetical protein [Xanthomonadales bacterium]
MKNTILLSALVLLGGLGFTVAASAADVTCDDLVWSASVLADNPNIGAACLDVENKQGQEVAKFRARVVRQSVNSTIIQWQLPDGSWSPAQRRYPERGFMAQLEGKDVKIADLPDRQEVNVYVPAGEAWSLPAPAAAPMAAAPVAAAPVAAAAMPEPEPEPAPAMLPTTATQVPLLALLGGLLVLLGGAIGFVRTRL